MLTPRQEMLLERVVQGHVDSGLPVGSKTLSARLEWGPSTIRHELAQLELEGLLDHPHTSAGRIPTDAGYRYFVDRLLPRLRETGRSDGDPMPSLSLVRREVDDALRATTETLSQVNDLLAIVSAPPLQTSTIRHVEVLVLQPQVLMVVVITSTGGVTKRLFAFTETIDPGLASWAASFLNEQLAGVGLGARLLHRRLTELGLGPKEQEFLAHLAPAFTELEETAEDSLFVDGAARLLSEDRVQDLTELNSVMEMLERRVVLLGVLRRALTAGERQVYVSIGEENPEPALRQLAVVAASYGLPARALGTVSVIGPVRMDYARAIISVREAAGELSRFVQDVYEER